MTTIKYLRTSYYLRLIEAVPWNWRGRPIAAVRLSDGRCFIDDYATYRQLVAECDGSPFAVLFPDALGATIDHFRTRDYERFAFSYPGDLYSRPLAARRVRDGRVFIDDAALFRLLQSRYGNDPFAVVFRGAAGAYGGGDDANVEEDLIESDAGGGEMEEDDHADFAAFDDDPDPDHGDWLDEWQQEYEGWHEDLFEAQGEEAYWQDSEYN